MATKVSDIFDIRYGQSLELNSLVRASPEDGIAFISRKRGDNGISAYVEPVEGIEYGLPGEISCALSGNGVLTTCLQEQRSSCRHGLLAIVRFRCHGQDDSLFRL